MSLDWLNAPVSQGYGPTDEALDGAYGGAAHFNKGIDYAVPVGTPIGALVGGRVEAVSNDPNNSTGWGKYVWVRGDDGRLYRYNHLDAPGVSVGDTISAGQVIGQSGNTGKSTGPHLSFDVSEAGNDGQFIDPTPLIQAGGASGAVNGRAPTSLTSNEGGATGGAGAAGATTAQQRAGIMEQVLDYLSANPPKQSDFTDPEEYSFAMTTWLEQVSAAGQALQQFQMAALGFTTGPDGSLIPYTSLDPQTKAYVDTVNENAWAKAMNDFQLTNYDIDKDRVQTDLGNITNRFNSLISLDNANISQANSAIARMLSGLGESRSRASLIADTQLAAAPWASPNGQTSFNAADLGGSIGMAWAQALGLDPNQSILNYTGTTTIDPAGVMAMYDNQFGVTGALPDIPSLLTGLGDVPGAPSLPNAPSLLAPSPLPPASLAAGGGMGAGSSIFAPSAPSATETPPGLLWPLNSTPSFPPLAPAAASGGGGNGFSLLDPSTWSWDSPIGTISFAPWAAK